MLAATLLAAIPLFAVKGARLSHSDPQKDVSTSIKTEQAAFIAGEQSSIHPTGVIKPDQSEQSRSESISETVTASINVLETGKLNSSEAASPQPQELDWSKVDQVPSYDQFCSAIDAYSYTRAGGHPPKPSMKAYYHYLDIVARNMPINEQAMLLANVVWETAGLQFVEEINCRNGGCPYGKYFGRGYIQLTWGYNYRRASFELYGDDRFLRHPELVAEELDAWRTTLWYWRTHVSPVLKQHDAVDNFLIGYAIMAINGQLECRPKSNAKERLRIYNGILRAWRLAEGPAGKMVGCLDEKRPTKTRASNILVSGTTGTGAGEAGATVAPHQKIAKATRSTYTAALHTSNGFASLPEVRSDAPPTPTYDPPIVFYWASHDSHSGHDWGIL